MNPEQTAKCEAVMSTFAQTKVNGVLEYGIGEPVRSGVHGWKGDELVCVALLPLMVTEMDKMLYLMGLTAVAMRRLYEIDSVAGTLEGFISSAPELGDMGPRFAANDKAVELALHLCYVDSGLCSIVSVPYKETIGRHVQLILPAVVGEWTRPEEWVGLGAYFHSALQCEPDQSFGTDYIESVGVELFHP